MKRILASILLIFALLPSLVSCTSGEKDLKYVFLFIGDGMSYPSIKLSELYGEEINFTDFESVGVFENSDLDSAIPDSASSGSAMATGVKTYNGVVAKNSSGAAVKSIASILKERLGMKVGIVTTANLNHATPAVFYAHSDSRKNYYEIGTYVSRSYFDLFIGGEFLDSDGGEDNLYTLVQNGGYSISSDFGEVGEKSKNILVFPDTDSTGMRTFSIDSEGSGSSLAQCIDLAIRELDGEEGFFIMCEGGRIDSALHANDAATAICEISDFSKAVDRAVEFYKKHPDETLIIVTGDHETGGLSLGYTETGYALDLDVLRGQTVSYLKYQTEVVSSYTADTTLDVVLTDIENLFGIKKNTLREFEIKDIERAFCVTVTGEYTEADYLLYSDRNPLALTVTRLVANRAGLDFSTVFHTASPMPLWAIGRGAETFEGSYSNTDIFVKLYELLIK